MRNIVLSVGRVLVSLQIKGCGLCREDCDISVLATICGVMLFLYIIYVYYMCIIVSVQSIADSIRSVFVIIGIYIFVTVSYVLSAVSVLVPVKVGVPLYTVQKRFERNFLPLSVIQHHRLILFLI